MTPDLPTNHLTPFWDIGVVSELNGDVVEASLADTELSARDFFVVSLLMAQGPLSPTEVSARSGIPAASVSKILARLIKRELVDESPHPTDRRSRLMAVSDRGRTEVAAAQEGFGRLLRRLYDVLGPEAADVIWSLRRLEWGLREVAGLPTMDEPATRSRTPNWIRYSGDALTASEETEVADFINWLVWRRRGKS